MCFLGLRVVELLSWGLMGGRTPEWLASPICHPYLRDPERPREPLPSPGTCGCKGPCFPENATGIYLQMVMGTLLMRQPPDFEG